jgi:DNA-binding phage protein
VVAAPFKSKGTISDQLKAAVKASGLTSYRVAKDAGITQIMLDRFMAGDGDLRLATAAKLCDALGLELCKRK